nr:hypothetical protein OG999_42170 [Streptomyces sp. NBC_00886]
MLSTKRRLTGVVLGSLLALGGTAAVPAAAQTPARATCGIPVNESHINQRWNALGGATGWLGCPTSHTKDVYLGNVYAGKRQYFNYGTVTWSPRQGRNMVVAAWEDGGYAYFNWGTTVPYRYDAFLVRWTSASDPGGTQREFGGGTSGRIRVLERNTGAYVFTVEGCDTGAFGHTCRQGWTLKASTPN